MRTTAVLSFAALAATAFAPSAFAQTWLELGPAPTTGFSGATGRISAIACDPTTASRVFVAGADGGVWRTTDAGATWRPITDDLPTTAIGALALDPTNPSIIYAGSGEANFANHSRYGLGVYKSVDGGDSWTVLAEGTFAGRCISRILISPADHNTLYASCTRAGGFPTLAAAKGHPAAAGPTGVYKSLDGGQTWTLLSGGLPALDATDLAMDPVDPQTLYAGIGFIFGSPSNGIYKTTDGGVSWTKLAGGLPTSGVGRVGLAVAPSLRTRLYTFIAMPADATGGSASTLGAFRSDNSGSTWTPLSNLGSIQSTYGWYFTTITVRPTDPNTVFFAALSVFRSTNSGASFTGVSPQHPDVHAAAWDAAGRLWLGDDGGVHRSADLGNSWTPLNAGLGTVQMYAGLSTHPTNPSIIYAGLQDNGTVKRTGATLTWSFLLGGDGGWTQCGGANGEYVFGESQGTGALARSTDGGASFSGIGSGISGRNCFLPPYLLDPHAPGRMIYATERLFVSTNYGSTFSPLSPDLTAGGIAAIRAIEISPLDSRYVYAATNDGRVLASENSGATFALRLTANPGWPRVTRELVAHPTLDRTVYLAGAAFGAPKLRRSDNRGASWIDLTGNHPDVPVNTQAIDVRPTSTVLYTGADDGVYRSMDGGAHWTRHGAGFPRTAAIDIRLEPARGRMIVGTQGRGAWLCALACPADFNGDGFVDFFDGDAFITCFDGGACPAGASGDFNGDGFVDFFDIDAFIEAFEDGC